MCKKVFPAELQELPNMLAFVCSCFEQQGFSEECIRKAELACEEAFVNIIHHGYPSKRGTIGIECSCIDSHGVKIIIQDDGISFNPLTAKNNKGKPLKDDKVGGYGIHLIISLMDEVTYKRHQNSNVLTLVKFKKRP